MTRQDWKILIITIVIWLTISSGYELETQYQVRNIKENWGTYCRQNLEHIAQDIQQKFDDIQQKSFLLLDQIGKELQDVNWQENNLSLRTIMFEKLLVFCKSHEINQRGFAIYKSSECVAWYNYDFEPAQIFFQHGLEGNRFSSIATNSLEPNFSQNVAKIGFSVLCSVIPIYDKKAEESRPVGVVVAFFTLDNFYPLNTPYICNQSFENQIQTKYPIPKISIYYGKKTTFDNIPKNSLQKPLLNIQQEVMGTIVLYYADLPDANTISSQDIVIQQIQSGSQNIQSITTSIFLFFLIVWGIHKTYQRIKVSWQLGIMIASLLIFLRTVWYAFSFPNQLLADSFNSPDVFHSLIFFHWSDSLCNLVVSSLLWLGLGWLFYRYCPVLACTTKTKKYIILATNCLGIVLFVATSVQLEFFLQSVVKHSAIYLFDLAHLYPSWHVASIYAATLCLGGTAVFITAWFLRFWVYSFSSRLWRYILIFGNLFLIILIVQFFDVSLFRVIILFICANMLNIAWPRRNYLRAISVLLLVSLFVYLVLLQCSNQKLRLMVQDRAEELQDDFTKKNIELTLDLFEQKSKILRGFEPSLFYQKNLAFLIWAENSISEHLDNLHLMIFAQRNPPQPNQKIEIMPRLVFASTNSYFQLISEFRLNLNVADGVYREWLKSQNPNERGITDNLYELGKKQNPPICMGILPIYDSNQQLQGVIVIFSRHAQISKTIQLPQVFTTHITQMPIPLLMASFEDGIMSDINIPWISKSFKLPADIANMEETNHLQVWRTDLIDGRLYDNFYFVRSTNPKYTIGMIGYLTSSWLFDLFYFFQVFLFGLSFILFSIAILSLWKIILHHTWRQCWRKIFCFEHKLLATFILISGVPVFIMGLLHHQRATEQIWNNYTKNLIEILHNTDKTIHEQIPLPVDPEDNSGKLPDDNFCQVWGERYQTMVNMYCVPYPFKLSQFPIIVGSNHRELFEIDLIPERIPGEVFYQIVLLRKELYITSEYMGNYPCLVGYKGLLSPQDKRDLVGVISISMIYRNNDVEMQIMGIMVTLFTLYAGFFLIVIVIGMILAYQISRPLACLTQAIHQVSTGNLEVEIPIMSQDEFAELIQSFNQMTKDLKSSREKVIQAEKDAAWREMARQIAHEIKNPLTPMKLSAQHLQRAYQDQAKNFDKILEKGIHTIIDAIDNLSKTAASFSEFAKFTKANLGSYALSNLINDCVSLFANAENVSIECQLPNLPNIITDPLQLKRVIINLLTNSIQAIQNPPGKIKITAYVQDSWIVLQIQDNGIGISDSVKARLFEPNFSTKSYGSGLGLAICKRAVDQMGGNISIASYEGQGTTVTVQLQMAKIVS